jgi:DNA-binding IclR family transcriptional regulator
MRSPGVGGQMATIGPWLTADGPRKIRTIKSAERTLALFEMFSLYQRPLGVGEIAKALNIPQPSVSMLVRNLASLGYLEHDRAARTYVPTMRIMLLGSWIHRRFSQENNLETRLEELVVRLGETVVMGIQNGIYSQYVLAQLPEDLHRLEVQSGLLRPITCTAVGRVLLSLKPDAEIEAIVRRCNAEVTEERLRVRPAAFMEQIEQIRAQGYARTGGDMTPGQAVIAISIPAPIGKMPMAIGVGGKIDRVAEKEDEILAALAEFRSSSPSPPDE